LRIAGLPYTFLHCVGDRQAHAEEEMNFRNRTFSTWFARAAVAGVFALNVTCALAFLLWPERYAFGFEIEGAPGRAVVQGFGILFLMWNATYPLVILQPQKQRPLFIIILIQQALGVVGETWLWLQLPAGHPALWSTGLRFILFDGMGLLVMGLAVFFLEPD
jgi:hypothetical protein